MTSLYSAKVKKRTDTAIYKEEKKRGKPLSRQEKGIIRRQVVAAIQLERLKENAKSYTSTPTPKRYSPMLDSDETFDWDKTHNGVK
jgi:hypothetical protein